MRLNKDREIENMIEDYNYMVEEIKKEMETDEEIKNKFWWIKELIKNKNNCIPVNQN